MTAVVDAPVQPDTGPPSPSGGVQPEQRGGLLARQWARGAGLVLALAVLGLLVLCSFAFGTRSVPLGTVFDALVDYDPTIDDHLVVHDLRIPRTLVGLEVGVALGLTGALLQGITRNPLAEPGLLGLEAGASLAVVMAITWIDLGALGSFAWFAFAGAAVAGVVVYSLGSLGRGGATPVKLAIAGAALHALLMSFVASILLLDVETLDRYRHWMVGSLAGSTPEVAAQMVPFLVVGAVLALGSARSLNALALGDDVARSLGQRVFLARGIAGVAVVILVGASVSAAGPIAFVGLAVPHVARALCGPDYRWILPWSLVLAPCVLLGADVVGRLVLRPSELEVGIVTAFLGAPLFIVLVRRRRLAEL